MLIRVFTLLVSALLLSGCVNSYNVSKKQPFCDYVGRTVPLQRPVLVVHCMSELGGGWEGVHSILYARYGLIDVADTNMGYGPILGELPVGHHVTIVSVQDEAYGDAGQIIAYGHTAIPPSTNQVSFVYPWGVAMSALQRAPWELDVAKQKGH